MKGQDSLLEPWKRTRKGDPDTSLAAAESVTGITEKQQAVLELLRRLGPLPDELMVVGYVDRVVHGNLPPQSKSGLRTRRSELVRRGLVKDTGERRRLVSGRMAIVWEAVDETS